MGQIKNIKLHIVTDIKPSDIPRGEVKNQQTPQSALHYERQMEEETCEKVEEEKKKDERKIKVNQPQKEMYGRYTLSVTCCGSVEVDLNVGNEVIDIQMQCCLYTFYCHSISTI